MVTPASPPAAPPTAAQAAAELVRKRIGSTIGGRYRVISLIGEGGMGAVYLVEHTLIRKRMALKVLNPDLMQNPEMVTRFEREALAAAHLEHANVVAATDLGRTEDGALFLVLEFVDGSSLRDVLAYGAMPPQRVLHIARQLVSALVRAHSVSIVHRDLKPDDVASGGGRRFSRPRGGGFRGHVLRTGGFGRDGLWGAARDQVVLSG